MKELNFVRIVDEIATLVDDGKSSYDSCVEISNKYRLDGEESLCLLGEYEEAMTYGLYVPSTAL